MKDVMPSIPMPFFASLLACAPSSQESVMRKPGPPLATDARESREAGVENQGAAQGPIPQPASAAENPAATQPADTAAEARGRRILSTAFVMIGPGGHLTVELRDGTVLVLRDVVLRARDYCGVPVLGDAAGTRYCGRYGDVAAARPGGAQASGETDATATAPFAPGRSRS